MSWLITGGAGYIGAHVVRQMITAGEEVVILDDLSFGNISTVPKDVEIVIGSITKKDFVELTLKKYKISGIINLAGLKSVTESEVIPEKYEEINVHGVEILLEVAKRFGIEFFIQSSSAAVYGNSQQGFVSEEDELSPISQYGKTKSHAESALTTAINHDILRGVSLRYFNVLGARENALQDKSKANILPMVLENLSVNEPPKIFGDDYPTKDGTCVRDYVHVEDIARAHVLAVKELKSRTLPVAINIGTGTGYSVREVMNEILKQTSSRLEPVVVSRRTGDPAVLVAKVDLATKELGFRAQKSLSEMISSSI